MTDNESGVWSPKPEDIERSEKESAVASKVEDDSLARLRNRDDAPAGADKQAEHERIERGDPRLEAGDAEQASINRNMNVVGWLIVLAALAGSLLVAFVIGYLREMMFG